MVSEKKIIEDCIRGKRYAHEQLYNAHAPIMLTICMRYSKDKSEAEDIMQEGFIKVFSNLKKFRAEGSFEGWIKRIMVNTALNHYQKNLKHYFHTQLEDVQDAIGEYNDSDFHPDENITRAKIMSLVQQLPEGYRFVFNLYVFEDYSHKEIAKMLNISINTSKTQLFKARRWLMKRAENLKIVNTIS
ncbi:MAG: sigma-70 family RNA polymerase sigma factor [Bacteroidota bacterium]|nr:sigma-70 family RNA polymerase sigma factor [Bacteroidota bacterium]